MIQVSRGIYPLSYQHKNKEKEATTMGKIWFSIGLFQLGMAAGYGLHFLSVIIPWWGIKTIILGWLLFIVLIACLWCFDEVFINWTKSIASASEYYLVISIATVSIIFGVITWALA